MHNIKKVTTTKPMSIIRHVACEGSTKMMTQIQPLMRFFSTTPGMQSHWARVAPELK
jgi:hypothetical protein